VLVGSGGEESQEEIDGKPSRTGVKKTLDLQSERAPHGFLPCQTLRVVKIVGRRCFRRGKGEPKGQRDQKENECKSWERKLGEKGAEREFFQLLCGAPNISFFASRVKLMGRSTGEESQRLIRKKKQKEGEENNMRSTQRIRRNNINLKRSEARISRWAVF